jgi:glycosyltransferase involved in cell wall biosynthesis
MKINLAIITTHPIQYQVPLFRALSKVKKFNSKIFYASDQGINKNKLDKEFNKKFSWNISMLKGYNFSFSKKNTQYESFFLRFYNLHDELRNINCNCILILGWNKLIYFQAFFFAIINKIPILLRSENNLNVDNSLIKKSIKSFFFPIFFFFFRKIFYIGKLNKFFYLYYKVKKSKLVFAPYFVDNNFFKIKKKKIHKKFNILFVGKFIDRKRPLEILKIAELLKNYEDIHFILVGDGPLLLKCKEWAIDNSLHNVTFKGFQNQLQMRNAYKNAKILINSSSYETWGLVVNEAMSAGLPCIVTERTGCALDLIKRGKTGFVYKLNDLVNLKNYILQIYSNKKNYLRMSLNSKNIVKKYHLQKSVKSISDVLISIK